MLCSTLFFHAKKVMDAGAGWDLGAWGSLLRGYFLAKAQWRNVAVLLELVD